MKRSLFCLALAFVSAACSGDDDASSPAGDASAAHDVSVDSDAGDANDAGNAGSAGSGGADEAGPEGGAGAGGAPALHSYRCDPVGTAPTDGIFSLRAFGGTLYVGLFGYGHESESMLYRYPLWSRVEPGLRGVAESVCAMIEFQGQLYANTESDGYIYRSADGATWERVFDGGAGQIGCGLAVHDNVLYAINYDYAVHDHGRVLRSADGSAWEAVYDSGADDLYPRHIISHDGMLYALSVSESASQGKILSSPDGTNWTLSDAPTRFFRALSWKGELYLSSTTNRSNGPAGIWSFGGGTPTLVHPVATAYVTELASWDDALWAVTSDGWKEATGSSSLLMSRDGSTWESVCAFSEAAAWAVAPLGDKLYVGTWEYGSHGQLYEVSIADSGVGGAGGSGGGTALDCGAISEANPAWEVCESGADYCAGVFNDGAGCDAFCAAAGLACHAKLGGDTGCVKEPNNVLACADGIVHQSDWCECR